MLLKSLHLSTTHKKEQNIHNQQTAKHSDFLEDCLQISWP